MSDSTKQICRSTQQQIKADYPDLKIADKCPVCECKIGYHNHVDLG